MAIKKETKLKKVNFDVVHVLFAVSNMLDIVLFTRAAQIFFGQKLQTPQGNLGQKVSALQF